MKISDIFKRKVPELEAIKTVMEPVNEQIVEQEIDRIKETLLTWSRAVENAEKVDYPDYEDLYDLYNNIEFDEHVVSVVNSMIYSLTQADFNWIKSSGEIDENTTAIFEKKWFYDFVKVCYEAELWGCAAFQFLGVENGGYSKGERINPYHIDIKNNGVKKNRHDYEPFIKFDDPEIKDWTILIKGERKLGLYNVIAKLFILKREVRQFWAVFNKLFTAPYLVVKTNVNNKRQKKNLIDSLQNMMHSGMQIVGHDDEIENVLNNNGAGYKSYEDFENQANKGISKVILGQTMTTEDGSSRSQGEVHERVKNIFVRAMLRKIEFVINDDVVPRMRNLGIKVPEGRGKFELVEETNRQAWSEIIEKLSNVFDLDEKEVTEKIGLTVEKKELPVKATDVEASIRKIYNLE